MKHAAEGVNKMGRGGEHEKKWSGAWVHHNWFGAPQEAPLKMKKMKERANWYSNSKAKGRRTRARAR